MVADRVGAEMEQHPQLSDQIKFLLLERRLLIDGKLVPDTGQEREHIEHRLRQIEQELQTCRGRGVGLPYGMVGIKQAVCTDEG